MNRSENHFDKLLEEKVKPFREFEGDYHRALWNTVQEALEPKPLDQIDPNIETDNLAGVTYYDTKPGRQDDEDQPQSPRTEAGIDKDELQTKKQDSIEKSDQISYSKIYRFLVKLVVAQSEPLKRLRSLLSEHQNKDLTKLLQVEDEETAIEEEDEDMDQEGGDAKKTMLKKTDLDKLLQLIRLLQMGQWEGRLSRHLRQDKMSSTILQEGGDSLAKKFLAEAKESMAIELADFPFAALFDEIVQMIELDPSSLLEVRKAFDSVELRETLRMIPSKERTELDRLLALTNQVIESGWQSEWVERLLLEEEERRQAEVEKKKAAAAQKKAKATPKRGNRIDPNKIAAGYHIGGTEFKKSAEAPPEEAVETPEVVEKPPVPSTKGSPVSDLLRCLTDFIRSDRENTIEMLCLRPPAKARLIEIIEEEIPIDNDPGREGRELATFQETLQILASGRWQHRALIQFSQRQHAAWLGQKQDEEKRAAAAKLAEEVRFRPDEFGRKRPICPTKVTGESFAQPLVPADTRRKHGERSEATKLGHQGAPPKCREKITTGAVEKERSEKIGPTRLRRRSVRSAAGLPVLPDHPVLRILRSLYIPSLQIADEAKSEAEESESNYEEARDVSALSVDFVRDQIMDRFGAYQ